MRDPIVEFMNYNRRFARRNPELLRLKVARMAEGPFAFFRGTFHLYARDLLDSAAQLYGWWVMMNSEKDFLALPHAIVLAVLAIAAVFVIVVAWFAILLTGRYPRALFDFVVGVGRWSLRVQAYALLLVTDRYPPVTMR